MRLSKILAVHINFWILFILGGIFINVSVHHNGNVTWTLYRKDLADPFTAIGYGRSIIVCYLTLWVIEWLFLRKKYFTAIAAILAMIIFDVFLRYSIEQLFIGPVFGLWQFHQGISIGEYFNESVLYSMLGIFLCFFLKVINDLFKNEVVKREQTDMELQFLKSQINPHFLFNTFNNLYGLSLSEPQKTPDAILKLSNMMRYMLYESNENEVPVVKEIAYLENMIELQKLRYDEDVFIDFTMSGNISEQTIAPCLLISFVENGFKHGELQDGSAPLIINFSLSQKELYFRVRNKIHHKNKDHSSGIGMKNVQRRLDLLYSKNYELKIHDDGVFFETELCITLH